MLATVITFLIMVCVYLVLWVLRDVVGLPIPEKVVQILWVIFALVVIYWLVQLFLGGAGKLPSISLR